MAKSITENDFLRGGDLEYLQNDKKLLLQLRSEADFYGMDRMKNEIEEKIKNIDYAKQASKKRFELIPLETFQDMYGVSPNSNARYEIKGMNEGSEFIGMIKYFDHIWVCPRGIYSHRSEFACGRLCRNQFVEDRHGWRYIQKTSVLITIQG
ncbi:hypothetical protein RO3G_12929 [Rhizopus delemar RA 99-880]|uniref:Uncharacterized protein n=1 Tax=Rhizopus delemar (strain RA 99-880 / ATCC MYA-4621 / FGSC 9543 / NRRL 43880) TaxID=246409 RepID=I1CID8_RHIO9|nr:hypothetical protein RO3G_12929 [Rhizopus delemar RA 99-880]|eukprot:EIE88218.1 hypothetical protein RO3G_12929 [Rhizopus delemar RA 99-880]